MKTGRDGPLPTPWDEGRETPPAQDWDGKKGAAAWSGDYAPQREEEQWGAEEDPEQEEEHDGWEPPGAWEEDKYWDSVKEWGDWEQRRLGKGGYGGHYNHTLRTP